MSATSVPEPAAFATPIHDPLSMFRLDGQVVVITGTSSGIGTQFARVLHAAGAQVVMAARRIERLEVLAAELPGSVPIACDVSVDAQCEVLVDATLARFGQIDVLINNAGTVSTFRPEEEPMAEWRRVMGVNIDAAFHLSQLVARKDMLLRRAGNIINVASVLGMVSSGRLTQASYAASKGALVNISRELACLWARKNIRVNALCPGFFDSELTHALIEGDFGSKWLVDQTPMGRIGAADELDGALLFLASRASTYVTGATLVVDGGWSAK